MKRNKQIVNNLKYVVCILFLTLLGRLIINANYQDNNETFNPVSFTFNKPIIDVHNALYQLEQKNNKYRHMQIFFKDGHKWLDSIFNIKGNEMDAYLWNACDTIGLSSVYFSKSGNPLPYYASFQIHLDSIDLSNTLITIKTIDPNVIVGRHLLPFPHGVRTYIYKKVVPTTVEEYEILLKIGTLLGEQNMPGKIIPPKQVICK